MLTSNQFELLSTTTDFPADMRRISLAVDPSSSHVFLLHARAHDYLAFCMQGDRGQLRPFAAVLPCLCLCASLLFADPLALFPASVLSPPLTRRADLVPSSCALPSLPRARPLGCPTAAFGGATAALPHAGRVRGLQEVPLAGSLGDLPLDDLLVGLGVDFREAEGREALLRGLLCILRAKYVYRLFPPRPCSSSAGLPVAPP